MKEVTLILTACNRVDLLKKTLDSFLALNTYPITRFIAHNDGNDKMFRQIKERYPQIEWHFSGTRIGYARSLDKLLSMVETEYLFSTEEDWSYYKNPGFIERSMKILEENPDIMQVWIRDIVDHSHPHGEEMDLSGIKVRPVIPGYRKVWNGFSLNPSLRRVKDWKTWFPEGLSKCGDGDEATLAQHTTKFNYKAVSLVESSIRHIGWNRRSINFKP